MTEKSTWDRLREPFPSELVSKLPATAKRPELDYVGHAAVTDRLLQVDPQWSWTWGVTDPETGRPNKALSLTTEPDGSISLWMALTVGGVTRVDVGYAPADKDEALKHVVSDALRRCAMRHGVALDLWMKDRTDDHTGPTEKVPCPLCGKPLRERNGAKGPFVGCSGYPDCRFIQNGTLADVTGPVTGSVTEPLAATVPPDTQLQELVRLIKQSPIEKVKEVFAQAHCAAALAPTAEGSWKLRGAAWRELTPETKGILLENVAALRGDVTMAQEIDEIEF